MGRQARARKKAQAAAAKAAEQPASNANGQHISKVKAKSNNKKSAKKSTPSSHKAKGKTAKGKQNFVPNSRLIKGFRILELFNDTAWRNFPRFIYVKRHFSNSAEGAERTVFVTGLPIDISIPELEGTLQRTFSRAFGPVTDVKITLLKDPDGNASVRCGHVVFEEEDAVEAALSEAEFGLNDESSAPGGGTKSPVLEGLQKYLEDARRGRPDVASLRASNNAAIAAVEAKEEAIKAEKERKKKLVDADGFTLVTGKRKISQAAAQQALEKRARREQKKRANMSNFYSFQRRETRRNQLAILRQKFEEDKQRVQRMKKARQFRPQ